jgi:riboflavin synthase
MNDITTNTKAFIGDNDINNADADDPDGSTQELTTGQVTADSVNVNARTEGHVETITVAAAMASSSQPNDPNKPEPWGVTDKIKAGLVRALGKYNVFTYGPNPPPAQPTPTEPKFGMAFSGTASVNKTNLTTLASVDGAKLDLTGGAASSLSVTAVTDTDIAAIGGSASLVRANAPSSERSAGLAGSVAVNNLTNSTTASVKDSTVTGADDVAVNALAGGEQLAVAIGAAVNASGKQDSAASAAGSVSISLANNTVSAGIEDTTVTGDAAATNRNLGVVAYDRTKLGTGGGSLVAGGKAGFGAAVTYSSINNTSEAFLSGATVSGYLR